MKASRIQLLISLQFSSSFNLGDIPITPSFFPPERDAGCFPDLLPAESLTDFVEFDWYQQWSRMGSFDMQVLQDKNASSIGWQWLDVVGVLIIAPSTRG